MRGIDRLPVVVRVQDDGAPRAARRQLAVDRRRSAGRLQQPRLQPALAEQAQQVLRVALDVGPVRGQVRDGHEPGQLADDLRLRALLVPIDLLARLPPRLRRREERTGAASRAKGLESAHVESPSQRARFIRLSRLAGPAAAPGAARLPRERPAGSGAPALAAQCAFGRARAPGRRAARLPAA